MSDENLELFDEPDNETVICTAKEAASKRILEYLKYSEISAYTRPSEDGQVDIIVAESEADKALQYVASFLAEEKKRAYKNAESDEPVEDEENIFLQDDLESDEKVFEVNANAHAYQTSSDKYSASMSSAFSFMFVGTAVLIILVLVYLNILNLPVKFSDNPLLSIILPIIAVAFEVTAIVSWKQAQKYRSEINSENQFDTDLKEWFYANYNAESIDALCNDNIHVNNTSPVNLVKKATGNVFSAEGMPEAAADENAEEDKPEETKAASDIPEELLFLQRLEAIESILNKNYPNLEKGYADVLSEEIYQKLFD